MSTRWMRTGGAVLLALTVAVNPVDAQRGRGVAGPAAQRAQGPHMGRSLELALEHRDQLELTDDQAAQLQELKAVVDGDISGLQAEMRELRSRIQGGEIPRDEGFRQMQALRGELITASAPLRGRVQEILTVAQHGKLQGLVRQERPGIGQPGALGPGRGGAVGRSGPGAAPGRRLAAPGGARLRADCLGTGIRRGGSRSGPGFQGIRFRPSPRRWAPLGEIQSAPGPEGELLP